MDSDAEHLGAALQTLGKREKGTERLEQAVAAYREALKELTRERVPLDWAMTQNNLSSALQELGKRENGTGKLVAVNSSNRRAVVRDTGESLTILPLGMTPVVGFVSDNKQAGDQFAVEVE